jgi:Tfp pilus assembly protein PilO
MADQEKQPSPELSDEAKAKRAAREAAKKGGKGGGDMLSLEATARTYRYLDAQEVQEMRKAAAGKKGKAGGKKK